MYSPGPDVVLSDFRRKDARIMVCKFMRHSLHGFACVRGDNSSGTAAEAATAKDRRTFDRSLHRSANCS